MGQWSRQITVSEIDPSEGPERPCHVCPIEDELHMARFVVDDSSSNAPAVWVCDARLSEVLPWRSTAAGVGSPRDGRVSAHATVKARPGGTHHDVLVYAGPDAGHRAHLGRLIATQFEAWEIARRINIEEG